MASGTNGASNSSGQQALDRFAQMMIDRFKVPEMRDTQGMYAHGALDRMVAEQTWLCPIQADRKENGAYYSPSRDIVVLPMKQQFNKGTTPEEIYRDGMEFYSSMGSFLLFNPTFFQYPE